MKSGLSQKILVPILALFALGMVTTSVVTSINARRAAVEESGHRLQRETRLSVRLIDHWLQARLIDLRLWAREEALADLLNNRELPVNGHDRAHRFLAIQQTGHPFFENIFLADAMGKIRALSTVAPLPPPDIHLIDRLYFQKTLDDRQIVSPQLLSRANGKRVFVVTAPIKAGETVVGVLGGVIDFSSFADLFINTDQEETAETAILSDATGVLLASSRPDIEVAPQDLVEAADIHQVKKQTIHGRDHLIVGRQLHHVAWIFATAQPVDTISPPLRKAGQISVFLALGLLAIFSLIVFTLFQRLLNHRLRAMLDVIGRVGQGDLGSRVPQLPGWKDEVNDLAASFNQMIDQLETNITQLNREIQMRKDSERMLAYHQENLETNIAERSLALEDAIIGRKQIKERLARAEKLEMIGELAGGVAHDLNNILSGIVTYPDLLLLKIAPENPLTAPLRSIKRSGEKAAAIVQDLLTLSGHSRLAQKTVCLNTIIREFLQGREYRNLLKRHPGIAINCSYGTELFPIQGAPAALDQVLFHLASYAATMAGPNEHRIVFTTENRVLATPLQAYEQIEPGNYAVLTMEYPGRGLTPEHLARIFEPFYTRKKLGLDGSGLGMAVVLGVVKEHGGFIGCMVDEGSGARISLFFPAVPAPSVQWPDPCPPQDDNGESP